MGTPTLSLGDKEIPLLFDGLLITKEQAASLTEEDMKALRGWGEDLGMNVSQEPESDPSGYVYLARTKTVDHGVVHKIGRSSEPGDRVQVFDTKMPVDVEIVNSFPVDDSARVETILQNRHDTDHVTGEWYDLDDWSIAELAHATGYEDGELTYTPEAFRHYMKDVGEVVVQHDEIMDEVVAEGSSHALSTLMKWSLLDGPDGLFQKLQDRVIRKERLEALARFLYWSHFEMRSSPIKEWDTPPERAVVSVVIVLNHHPDLDPWDTEDDRMQLLADAFLQGSLAGSEAALNEMRDTIGDVVASDREADKLINKLFSILLPHHSETDAHFEEKDDGS